MSKENAMLRETQREQINQIEQKPIRQTRFEVTAKEPLYEKECLRLKEELS